MDHHQHVLRPTGKSVKTCPARCEKIFRSTRRANQRYQLAPSFPGTRGVSRSSRTRDGMRWTRAASARNGVAGRLTRERSTGAQDDGAFSVRQNRVVPTPVAGAKLSVAASIRPDPMRYQAGSDGDKTNSLAGERSETERVEGALAQLSA